VFENEKVRAIHVDKALKAANEKITESNKNAESSMTGVLPPVTKDEIENWL
jgi:hypothetical protein